MPFWYSPAQPDGSRDTGTEVMILPSPTEPDYEGTRFIYSIRDTDAGGVKQRLRKKSKEKRWVWVNYTPQVPTYETLYNELFALQDHVRTNNGDSPYVYLKEDVTKEFGIYSDSTSEIEPDWIRCIVTYVGRTPAKGGGKIRYDVTELRFILADPDITEII